MAWVYDGALGRLEYFDRRGERVYALRVGSMGGAAGILDVLFLAAESAKLSDEDVGRLVRLLAARRKSEGRDPATPDP